METKETKPVWPFRSELFKDSEFFLKILTYSNKFIK